MVPEILDVIGEYAGTYFLLAVGRAPTRRQLLRDGGICRVLEQILETGGDIRMLLTVKELCPDPDLALIKAVWTRDPFLILRVRIVWNRWYSEIADGILLQLERVNTDYSPCMKSSSDTDSSSDTWTDYGSEYDSSENDSALLEWDPDHDVTRIKQLRESGDEIPERIVIQGTQEHAMWLINKCVDMGYSGMRYSGNDSSRVESGVIYYKYPSLYDPNVACYMYFEGHSINP